MTSKLCQLVLGLAIAAVHAQWVIADSSRGDLHGGVRIVEIGPFFTFLRRIQLQTGQKKRRLMLNNI